jgi:hypothetical protein
MADKTTMHYHWMDVDYVMKNVTIYVYDDHIMLIEGVKAEKRFTYDRLYLEDIPEDEFKKFLPTKKYTSFWGKKEYIRGTYGVWEDHKTSIYTKLENYKIVVEP